jgi:hypothetical protein
VGEYNIHAVSVFTKQSEQRKSHNGETNFQCVISQDN